MKLNQGRVKGNEGRSQRKIFPRGGGRSRKTRNRIKGEENHSGRRRRNKSDESEKIGLG